MLLVPFGGKGKRARGLDDGNIPTQPLEEDELNNLRDTVHGKSHRRSSFDNGLNRSSGQLMPSLA